MPIFYNSSIKTGNLRRDSSLAHQTVASIIDLRYLTRETKFGKLLNHPM